jgi:hypothetical protein
LQADFREHPNGFHVDWAQMRVDRIANGVSRIWFRFDHTSSGEVPPALPPPTPPTSISMQYFRGACTVGTVGAPCNESAECGAGGVCGVTPTVADDVTLIGGLPGPINDLYRGRIGPGINRGNFAAPVWTLNFESCWDPPFGDWIVASTGPISQVADPNPSVGFATYYDYTIDTGFGAAFNVNDLGCSNPGLCRNPGWCELGPSAGAPCAVAADCASGACVTGNSFCSRHTGSATNGGCAAHPVCVGGANAGRLCVTNADCPSSSCVAPSLPGGQCANVSLYPGQLYEDGCPHAGDPLTITRVVSGQVLAACP